MAIRFLLIILLSLRISFAAKAQQTYGQNVNLYTIAVTTSAYTPITGGTVIATATSSTEADSNTLIGQTYTNISIPFTFTFNNRPYTSFSISSSGYLIFGPATGNSADPVVAEGYAKGLKTSLTGVTTTYGSTTSGSSVITNVTNTAFCVPGAPIQGSGIAAGSTIQSFTSNTITLSIPATGSYSGQSIKWPSGEIRVQTTGTAPNRTLIVQYSKFGASFYALNYSFQIQLLEGGGIPVGQKVRYVYGTFSGNNSDIVVGLQGSSPSYFLHNSSITGNTAATNFYSVTSGTASSGTTLTYTPPAACGAAPAAQPDSLKLRASANSIYIKFRRSVPPANAYLMVLTQGAALSTIPADGRNYFPGDSIGNGVVVAYGADTVFTTRGLANSTNYRITVFAATAQCTGPRYLTAAPKSDTISTIVPTAYSFTPPVANNTYGSVTSPTAWTPNRYISEPTDTLYFNSGMANTLTTAPAESVAKLYIGNNTSIYFAISNTLTVTRSFTIDSISYGILSSGKLELKDTATPATGLINGSLIIGNYTRLLALNSHTTVNGTVSISGATTFNGGISCLPSTLTFAAGSTLKNTGTETTYMPDATYDSASTILLTKEAVLTNISANKIGNLTVDLPANLLAGYNLDVPDTVLGKITVTATGSTAGSIRFKSGTSGRTDVYGDYYQGGGNVELEGGTTLHVMGSTTFANGQLDVNANSSASAAKFIIDGNFSQYSYFTVIRSKPGGGSLVFGGSMPQAITMGAAASVTDTIDYVLDNPAGATLGGVAFPIYKGGSMTITRGNFSGPSHLNFNNITSTLRYNGTGPQTATNNEWYVSGTISSGPTTLIVDKPDSSALIAPFSRSLKDSLVMKRGDLVIDTGSLTLGLTGASSYVSTLRWYQGSIRVSTGRLIRWTAYSAPTVPGTGAGFYPLASMDRTERSISLYYNDVSALTGTGTIGVGYTNAGGLTTNLSVPDNATTLTTRSNGYWTFTKSAGIALSYPYLVNVKATVARDSAFYVSSPADLHLMQAAGVVGTHIPGSGSALRYSVQRTGLTFAELTTGNHYIGAASGIMLPYFFAVTSGSWSTPSIWSSGIVPGVNDAAQIIPGVTVNTDAASNTARALYIRQGATLNVGQDSLVLAEEAYNGGITNISGGVFKIAQSTNDTVSMYNAGVVNVSSGAFLQGPAGGGMNGFVNNGLLQVTGGNMAINGYLTNTGVSTFNQSGGSITLDGNTGAAATSSRLSTLTFNTRSVFLTGGTVTIADPPVITSPVLYAVNYTGLAIPFQNLSPNHTFIFGDGINGAIAAPFRVANINLGGITVNGPALSGRYVDVSVINMLGNLTINNGGDFRVAGLYIKGDLTNNTGGSYTSGSSIYFCDPSVTATTNHLINTSSQSVSGGGSFKTNSLIHPTTFYSIYVYNSSAGGVRMNIGADVSFYGTLYLYTGRIFMGNYSMIADAFSNVYTFSNFERSWVVGKFINRFTTVL